MNNVKFVVSKSKNLPDYLFQEFAAKSISLTSSPLFDICENCDLAVVASGTATLECAISKTPFITVYKTSFLSWVITQSIVKLKFASIGAVYLLLKLLP